MLLWQIRQFPNEQQDWFIQVVFRILLIFSALTSGSQELAAEPAPATASVSDEKISAAEFFRRAAVSLGTRRSIQAQLVEQVNISDRPIRLTGRYIGQGKKLRLELSVRLAGEVEGSLLEVSDGDVLWNETVLGETHQVTLRNLKQIAAAMEGQSAENASRWEIDLGLGGLTGLIGSLERTMDFEQLREEGDFVIVQGKWKAEVAEKWQRGKDQQLPSYIPDLLRIYFHAETLFPHRFLYLKRVPEKKTYRSLVRLEFQQVKLDEVVDDSFFQYTQPSDIVPDDVTQRYIEELMRRSAPAGEAAKTQ